MRPPLPSPAQTLAVLQPLCTLVMLATELRTCTAKSACRMHAVSGSAMNSAEVGQLGSRCGLCSGAPSRVMPGRAATAAMRRGGVGRRRHTHKRHRAPLGPR